MRWNRLIIIGGLGLLLAVWYSRVGIRPGVLPSSADHISPSLEMEAAANLSPSGAGTVSRVVAAAAAPMPGAAASNLTAAVRLAEMRRGFRAAVIDVGPVGPPERAVVLEGYRLHAAPGAPRLEWTAAPGENAVCYAQFRGPIEPAWRAAVEAAGGVVLGYLPRHTLLVEVTSGAARRLLDEPALLRIHPVRPEHKLQPFLAWLAGQPVAECPERLTVTLTTYTAADLAALRAELEGQPVRVLASGAGRRWAWARIETGLAELSGLAALPWVQWIEEYVPPRPVNDWAVAESRLAVTPVWSAHGLTGAGEIIGHADTGLDVGDRDTLHPDIRGRLRAAYALGRVGRWDDPAGHGTHTAGSIMGNGAQSGGQFRGVAWEAELVHQSVLDAWGGLGGLPLDLNELFAQAHGDGARIHSDSWGSAVYGSYTSDSRQCDEFMWDHPDMLLVFSASNDGVDGDRDGVVDFDSMGAPATAKNLLAVGAAESMRPSGSGGYSSLRWGQLWPLDYPVDPIRNDPISLGLDPDRQGLAAFSSRGPTDDGRTKPDVVGPGTDIVSLRSGAPGASVGWGAHVNPAYAYSGGTSMSAPLVAGAAALVRQYYREQADLPAPSAALVKATLMHGAHSLYPGQYGTNSYLEVPAARPNDVEGWGHVNLAAALFPVAPSRQFFLDATNSLAAPGAFHDHVFAAEAGAVLLSLVYTDYPAEAGAGLKLVNDLDLTLRAPDGTVRHPRADGTPDRLNNAERLAWTAPVSGIYTARVTAFTVPLGPQSYALIARGLIDRPAEISHEPLANIYDTEHPIRVGAHLRAPTGYDPGSFRLHWNTLGPDQPFAAVAFNPAADDFEAFIPAQTLGTRIYYYIEVTAGPFTTLRPAACSTAPFVFEITPAMPLTIDGAPAPHGVVQPDYGAHLYAVGNVVTAVAPAYVQSAADTRMACRGFTGTGDVPASGAAHALSWRVTQASSLVWQWETEYRLWQTSNVPELVATATWWAADSSASSVTATVETNTPAGDAYGLAGWYLDGQRQPDDWAVAVNPVVGLLMNAPRVLEARYLPAQQDSDGDGLPDWWEAFYFGLYPVGAFENWDGDGYVNRTEYRDRTHPRDAGSRPVPPVIMHQPLTDPRAQPAPWNVQAEITDNHRVASATLSWRRNDGPWQEVALDASAGSSYAGALAAPGTNGDTFAYLITAFDEAGLRRDSGPYTFTVAYPRLTYAPGAFAEQALPAGGGVQLPLHLTNEGLATLEWELAGVLEYHDAESGSQAWTHAGQNDLWHQTEARAASPTHAWHFGRGPGGGYDDSADAALISPPLELAGSAWLEFRHWARMEPDDDQPGYYWDGAVVEISTDGGATFAPLTPEGGYPHRITPNPASPFAPDTPCYGATEGWETARFDLGAHAGETVQIRLRFGSDAYVTDEGWYVDDLVIGFDDPGIWDWFTAPPDGTLAPGQSIASALLLTAASRTAGEQLRAVLALSANDPLRIAPILFPIELEVDSRQFQPLPPDWLAGYGLTNRPPEVEALLDPDRDGLLTWQEFEARTNPLDPASYALVLRAPRRAADGAWRVEWLSFTNRAFRYRLEQTDRLDEGFQPVAEHIPADPPINSHAPGVDDTPPARYFRVIRQ